MVPCAVTWDLWLRSNTTLKPLMPSPCPFLLALIILALMENFSSVACHVCGLAFTQNSMLTAHLATQYDFPFASITIQPAERGFLVPLFVPIAEWCLQILEFGCNTCTKPTGFLLTPRQSELPSRCENSHTIGYTR